MITLIVYGMPDDYNRITISINIVCVTIMEHTVE